MTTPDYYVKLLQHMLLEIGTSYFNFLHLVHIQLLEEMKMYILKYYLKKQIFWQIRNCEKITLQILSAAG